MPESSSTAATAKRPKRSRPSTLKQFWSRDPSPLTIAVLVFPVFAIYQIGVVFTPAANGVDLVTTLMVSLVERNLGLYIGLNLLLVGAFVGVMARGRRRGGFDAAVFVPLLVESGLYALSMGSLIVYVMRDVLGLGGLLQAGGSAQTLAHMGAFDRLVVSCGAGFHEELVFRLGLFGSLTLLLHRGLGARKIVSVLVAALCSSAIFSAVHHLGPYGEPFAAGPFVYRVFAGLFFAALFRLRNFAVAVYTHTIYDLYVLLLQ